MTSSSKLLLRMLDANANRAREGLRVCEDLARFCLESPASFRAIRAVRQALNLELRRLPMSSAQLVRFRDSRQDVGRRASSSSVRSAEHLLLLNLQRAKEALRVLEECARVSAPRQAPQFQALRFQTYHVERQLLLRVAALRHRGSRRRA